MGDNGIFGGSVFGGAQELSGFGALPFAINQPVATAALMPRTVRLQPSGRPALPQPPCGYPITANPLGPSGAALVPQASNGGALVQPIGPGVSQPPRLVAVPPQRQASPLVGTRVRTSPIMIAPPRQVPRLAYAPIQRAPIRPGISASPIRRALSGLGALFGFGQAPVLRTQSVPLAGLGACGTLGCSGVGFGQAMEAAAGFGQLFAGGALRAGAPEAGRERGGIFDEAPQPTPIGDMVPWRRPNAGGVVRVPPGCQPPTLPSITKPPTLTVPPIGPRPCWQPPAPCAPQPGSPRVVLPAPSACSQLTPRATSGFGWW